MSVLHLFEGFGIELELMIVDAETLAVRPIADELLKAVGGGYELEVERGEAAWSNELQLHVIEMKTNGPAPRLEGIAELFQTQVLEMEAILGELGARLLPTGMHPTMVPERELRLWPHENDVIYKTFDRIFDCRGHGWSNLQSLHVNLPFANDDELGRLHAAVRLVLPLLPALSASSPVVEGKLQPELDHRLAVYQTNARRVPSVSGRVVPEPVYTRAEYEELVLGKIYRDLEPHDPEGVLRHEWVNARGAICRFDRMALEIRTLDAQEHPGMDLSVASAAVAAVRALVEDRWAALETKKAMGVDRLADLHDRVIREGSAVEIDDAEYLEAFGLEGPTTVHELWRHLIEREIPEEAEARPGLDLILDEGCLAQRIRTALGPAPEERRVQQVYRGLAECLRAGRAFRAAELDALEPSG